MSELLDISIAKCNWAQNTGLALFATGFVILGFIYAVSSNTLTAASGLLSIRNVSNATISAGLISLKTQAAFQSTVLFIAGIAALIGGMIFLIISIKGLNVIESKRYNKLSIEINAPVNRVFEFTINPKNTHLWVKSIIRETTNETPVRVGTIYENVNSRNEKSKYKVTKFEANKLFELQKEDSSYHVRYTYAKKWFYDDTTLTYREWVDDGKLEEPFTLSILAELKQIIEQ